MMDFTTENLNAAYAACSDPNPSVLGGMDCLPVMVRDSQQQTLLSTLLRSGKIGNEMIDSLDKLLDAGAAKSVFVKGAASKSLICTLPMAVQPATIHFSWPAPSKIDTELLRRLDLKIADSVRQVHEESIQREKEAEERKAALAKEQEKEKEKKESSGTPKLGNPPPFDAYPLTLKVGQLVRRSEHWRYSDEDCSPITLCRALGEVISVASVSSRPAPTSLLQTFRDNDLYVTVEWKVKGPQSKAFAQFEYRYGAKHHELMLVDSYLESSNKSNAKGGTSGDPSEVGPVKIGTAGLPGNKVYYCGRHMNQCRCGGCDGRCGPTDGCPCESCLRLLTVNNSSSSSTVHQKNDEGVAVKFGSPTVMVSVRRLTTNRYSGSNKFAFGGQVKSQSTVRLAKKGRPDLPDFKPGDLVTLNPSKERSSHQMTRLNIEKSSKLRESVGVITDITKKQVPMTPDMRGSLCHVANVMLLKDGEHATYAVTDLVYADGSSAGQPSLSQCSRPLSIGDLVCLKDGYSENKGNGWCLGDIDDPVRSVGIVQFAPPGADNKSTEQRGVLVSSIDNPDKTFQFKSGWLQRAICDGKTYFMLGDLVRLDNNNCDRKEARDKCLGNDATLGHYGIVKDEGIVRDGIQRNIIVEACVGEQGEQSLYPSYCLNVARKSSVMTAADMELLVEVSKDLFPGYNLDYCTERIRTLGLKVWSFYMSLVSSGLVSAELVMETWKQWNSLREDWPLFQTESSRRLRQEFSENKAGSRSSNSDWDSDNTGSEAVALAPAVSPHPTTWACANSTCTIIGPYPSNPITSNKCVMCKRSAPKWSCEACSSRNPHNSFECKVCFISRNESDALGQQKVSERKKKEVERTERREKLRVLAEQKMGEENELKKNEAAELVKTTDTDSEVDAESSKEASPISSNFSFGTKTAAQPSFSETQGNSKPANPPFGFGTRPTFGFSETQGNSKPANPPFGFGTNPNTKPNGFGTKPTFGTKIAAQCSFSGTQGNMANPPFAVPKPNFGTKPAAKPILFAPGVPNQTESSFGAKPAAQGFTGFPKSSPFKARTLQPPTSSVPIFGTNGVPTKLSIKWKCVECTYTNSTTDKDAPCEICNESRPVLDGLPEYAYDRVVNRFGNPLTLGNNSTSHVYFCTNCKNAPHNRQCTSCVGYTIFSASALQKAPLNRTVNSTGVQQLVDFPPCCPKLHLMEQSYVNMQNCAICHTNVHGQSVYVCTQCNYYQCMSCSEREAALQTCRRMRELPRVTCDKGHCLTDFMGMAGPSCVQMCKCSRAGKSCLGVPGIAHFCEICAVEANKGGVKGCFGSTLLDSYALCTNCFDEEAEVQQTPFQSCGVPESLQRFISVFDAVKTDSVTSTVNVPENGSKKNSADVDAALFDSDDENESESDNANPSSTLIKSSTLVNDANSSDDDFELQYNLKVEEGAYYGSPDTSSSSKDQSTLTDLQEVGRPSLRHNSSKAFYVDTQSWAKFEEIFDIESLLTYADKDGNTALHHASYIGLEATVTALLNAGANGWLPNVHGDTSMSLKWLPLHAKAPSLALHNAVAKRGLLPESLLKSVLQNTDFEYTPSVELSEIADILRSTEIEEDDALDLIDQAIQNKVEHALLYRSVFYLEQGYGTALARQDLDLYIKDVVNRGSNVDPLMYYVYFLLWKRPASGVPSHAKLDRLRAADALTALRCFPATCSFWLDVNEQHDSEMKDACEDDGAVMKEKEEDDYDDILPPPGPNDPEVLWTKAKTQYPDRLKSTSMDQLMGMTGLKRIKEKALAVATQTLLAPPADIKSETSMNFLFMGNPGCGKTTVANLLSNALSELGYRKNSTPVITNSADILGASDTLEDFNDKVKDAVGGTLCIDEATLFDPNPRGKTANDSNKVLDALLGVTEKHMDDTTFILCGYKDELLDLMTYNPGFNSRFAKSFRFEFDDYNEDELTLILYNMVKGRNMRFESKAECGIAIAKVLARRMMRGANKKDFGNGRECLKVVESCIEKQKARLGKLMLDNVTISDWDHRTLTRADTIGERPRLEESVYMKELNAMVGLKSVKENVARLMNLQIQNHDAEMRGERPQQISLHRVFYGNPGTGKTTVAKLMGKLLKVFGFLSEGDMISVTPSDLKGSHVGEAGEKTRKIIEQAKGKVLFIDEAYNLDPSRHTGSYGAEVIDTILEKIEGNAGSDMCLILAGYKPQMEGFFRNANNEGLKRRFNLSEAFDFEDFTDEEIRKVLKNQIVRAGLMAEPSTLDFAVEVISRKRMEDGFGNAGEAEQIFTRAKLRLSQRIANASTNTVNMKMLLPEDFEGEQTSILAAHEAFAGLNNIEHVEAVLQRMTAMVTIAKQEGRPPHEIMSDMHMLFLGPPGTGKTTCGKRFAIMLKQLEILPTDRFHYTTANQLIGRYVGSTGNNTTEAMKKAKGGILFVDEAYGMLPKHGNSFGRDIMQTLLDGVTSEEFKGKLIVILGGYEEHVTEIFNENPGFQSRFDKMRVYFPEWNADQSASALINKLEGEGKTFTQEAKNALPEYFDTLVNLDNWASARDVMENIRPNLETARAGRAYEKQQAAMRTDSGSDSASSESPVKSRSRRLSRQKGKAESATPIPYDIEDVKKVFTSIIKSRGGGVHRRKQRMKNTEDLPPVVVEYDDVGPPPAENVKTKEKKKIVEAKARWLDSDEDDEDDDDFDVWAALEEAAAKLGYSVEDMATMLADEANFPPPDILAEIQNITGCTDAQKITKMLKPQRVPTLQKVQHSIKEAKKQKSEKAKAVQAACRRLGRCPMDYEWLPLGEGCGYRCAGGSHFISDASLCQELKKDSE